MYCLFQSSERPLDGAEEFLEGSILFYNKIIAKNDLVFSPEIVFSLETKKTLCEAIKIFWLFFEEKLTDSPYLKFIVEEDKKFFVYYSDVAYYLDSTEPKHNIRLRLHFLSKEYYKISVEEKNDNFYSIGIPIKNNQNLINVLPYLLGIIECERIVYEKIQEDTIIKEFIQKNQQYFISYPGPLIMKMAIIIKVVKKFFKNLEIKTKEQMANLQKTIEVKITKSGDQGEKIKIEISVPTEEVSCKVVLYCEKTCFGIKIVRKTGTKKKEKTWRIFNSKVLIKKLKDQEHFNQRMNKITGLNKKYGKATSENETKQPIKDQSDLNQETNKTTGLKNYYFVS